jgi:hypothetical protein
LWESQISKEISIDLVIVLVDTEPGRVI